MPDALIYVPIVGEGVDVWRPVPGQHLGGSIYRLLDSAVVGDGEVWEFPPGAIVCCASRTLSGGEVLVAVRLAGAPAERVAEAPW
jgi:hypothetical protein